MQYLVGEWGQLEGAGVSFVSSTQNSNVLPGPQCPHWTCGRGQGMWSEGPWEIHKT